MNATFVGIIPLKFLSSQPWRAVLHKMFAILATALYARLDGVEFLPYIFKCTLEFLLGKIGQMSQLHISKHPLLQHKLTILRDVRTPHRIFREVAGEMAKLLCYEATADLELIERPIKTPLTETMGYSIQAQIGLIPILRAGLGLLEGMLELIPDTQVWHLGLYRDEKTLSPVEYYNKLPVEPTVQVCLILDPMLATGGSSIAAVDILKAWGVKRIKFVGLIGAPEGIQALSTAHPDVDIHLAAVDSHLNEVGFIVPGLGDAGDRQFGTG